MIFADISVLPTSLLVCTTFRVIRQRASWQYFQAKNEEIQEMARFCIISNFIEDRAYSKLLKA